MRRIRQLIASPYLVWLLLALPAVRMSQGYIAGTMYYGEFMHASGEIAAELLIVALAITPLRTMFPRAPWVPWLTRCRRYIGVAAFAYALLHAVAYTDRIGAFATIVEQGTEASMWTGWLALAIMLPLALTSNDASMRRLRRRWKRLHRLAYGVAVLTLAHWYLAAFDPSSGLAYFGVLACLEIFRIWRQRARARSRPV